MPIQFTHINFAETGKASDFIKEHKEWLLNGSPQDNKETYLQLQLLCKTVKSSSYLLNRLSTEEIDILTTNKHYRLVGLTPDIAKIFIAKKSFHIFNKPITKSLSWLKNENFNAIFSACMENFSYSQDEINSIYQNLYTHKDSLSVNISVLYPQNSKTFSNPALFEIFKLSVTKNNEQDENGYEQAFFKNSSFRNKVANMWGMILNSDDETLDKTIELIPTLDDNMVIFLLQNNPFSNSSHKPTSFASRYDGAFDDNLLNNFFNSFENPLKIKKIFSSLFKKMENQLEEFPTQPKNFSFNMLNVKNNTLFYVFGYNNLNIPLGLKFCSEKIKPYIFMKIFYNFCNYSQSYSAPEDGYPIFPPTCYIDALKSIPQQNWNQIVKEAFRYEMPVKQQHFANILLSFAYPDNYKLSEINKNQVLLSILDYDKNQTEKIDHMIDSVLKIDYTFFDNIVSDHPNSKILKIKALEKQLNQNIQDLPYSEEPVRLRPKKF